MVFYFCVKRKIAAKTTMHQNSAVSKKLLGKFNITDHKYWFWNPEIYCIPRTDRLLDQTTKQTLSNFEPQKPWKYKQLSGLKPDI